MVTVDYETLYELYRVFAKVRFNITTGLNQYDLFSRAYSYTKELIEKMEKGEGGSFEDLKAAVAGLKSIVLLMLDFILKAERDLDINVDKMLNLLINLKINS